MPPRTGQPPAGPQPLPGVGAIVAVGSGKGGVGKTTLAVNLALALAKMGHKTGLLDADVYGPNVPLMLGTSGQPRALGENRIEPLSVHGLKVISVARASTTTQTMRCYALKLLARDWEIPHVRGDSEIAKSA